MTAIQHFLSRQTATTENDVLPLSVCVPYFAVVCLHDLLQNSVMMTRDYSEKGLRIETANAWLVDSSVSGRSGLVVSMSNCGVKGHRIEPALQTVTVFFTKITAIRSFEQGLHTYSSA